MLRTFFMSSICLCAHAISFSDKLNNVLYATGVHLVEDHRGVSISIPTDAIFLQRKDPADPAIDPNYFYVLDEVVNVVQNYSNSCDISITGHTDDLWTSPQEKIISRVYADEIARYLVSRGIDGRRIVMVEGMGTQEPVTTNRSANGRAINRRVELLLRNVKEVKIVPKVEEAPIIWDK